MYGWLYDACDRSAVVVTAGRRLARQLTAEYHRYRLESGDLAWRTPPIRAIGDWYSDRFDMAAPEATPARLSASQSRLLWEHALRAEIRDSLVNVGNVVRQAREAWQRLNDWQVPFDEFTASAAGRDQRLFARAAARYRSDLESAGWIDDAMLGPFVLDRLRTDAALPAEIVFAGFDRTTPLLDAIVRTLGDRGCRVEFEPAGAEGSAVVQCHETTDAELRAAGASARQALAEQPGARIAIVVSDLEQQATRAARLVREGLVPGWQHADSQLGAALNVSYGRPLADYPAIAVAAMLLHWCHDTLSAREVGLLLRTPFLGAGAGAGRTRLDVELREAPDRAWTPELFLLAFDRRPREPDATDWLMRLARIVDESREFPRQAPPARWAETIDRVLERMGWPGSEALGSVDFQLVDRWRALLNELAALGQVVPGMPFADAVSQAVTMARETLFQPERSGAVVQLLGPLEAAGLRFDRLWVSGCTADAWPPAGKPLPLLSLSLQQRYGMPDAEPADTTAYAQRVLARLRCSASQTVFSYAAVAKDSEQTVSPLLDDLPKGAAPADPGWHAARLRGDGRLLAAVTDCVPPLGPGERVAGGARIIDLQLTEPFSAFAAGRLGIKRLQRISPGVSAPVRGNLVHAALHRLYEELPSQTQLRAWDDRERESRIASAIDRAFAKQSRSADPVLREILALERLRAAALLLQVIEADLQRDAFSIDSVECESDITVGGVTLRVRPDRVDRFADGGVAILDYKTGEARNFIKPRADDPDDLQPVVYAMAVDSAIAELGFYNVGGREVSISSASRATLGEDGWTATLSRWQSIVEQAAADFASGDVRINGLQGIGDARTLALLSRIGELRRGA